MLNVTEKFRAMKQRGEKITALTAYDYPSGVDFSTRAGSTSFWSAIR